MKLLVVICDRKKTKTVLNLLNENDVNYHVSFYGKGTADNEMLSYLGLAESEKEVVISLAKKEMTKEILKQLESAPAFKYHGAVAFAVPLDAINKSTLKFIEQ